uniref:Uncharacterized protein n=1 Tax=Mastacembelus armatus TaxID=205130 RepID=A0A7N8Y8N5_9TELE
MSYDVLLFFNQGVSKVIRIMCQGPQSLGLQRSCLISSKKKSAVWPVPSHLCFHLTPVFSSIQSCLQSCAPIPHLSFFAPA